MTHNNDWMVLITINAPRHVMVTGDDLEAWLRGTPAGSTSEVDTMGHTTQYSQRH